jgi:uncharacterized membrane protein (Fun14 family)
MVDVGVVDDVLNWIKAVWDNINVTNWFNKIGITSPEAIRVITFFIVAFVIGFLFKKYFKFALGCVVVISVLFFVLQSKNILTVDWVAFKEFFGVDPTQAEVGNFYNMSYLWIKTNLVAFVSACIGFLLGYKLG